MYCLLFFFLKSSKEMPKNMQELICELKVQWCGVRAMFEDMVLRGKNKVGEFVNL